MQIKRLDNIGIAVSDIRRAIAFYTDVLGLEGQAGESDGSVTVGDLSFYVFQTNKAPAPVGRTADYMNNPVGLDHLAFEVADIEQAGPQRYHHSKPCEQDRRQFHQRRAKAEAIEERLAKQRRVRFDRIGAG